MTHDSSERPIVLIGMMGAGKSLVGAQLARNLGCPFRDVDALVEARVGMSVADVFRDRGEHAFRDHEASVLQSVLGSSEFCVVSTGGGAVLREESVAQMRAHGIVVWLRASIDTLAARLGSGAADRPLLAGGDLGEQLASLAQERNELYRAAANVIVDTDGMEPSEIADAVLAELRLGGDSQRAVVHVRGIGSDYDICIEPASFNQIADRVRGVRQVVMVTQRNLLEPWASQLEDVLGRHGIHHSTITIDDGEDAKRLSTVETLCRQFAARGLLRDDAVIALGGGVVGDIAGFAAAIYHRGIAVHQVPTSLLAMVDSSVGGKTGVNLPEGKNLIGAFHQPASVTIDPLVLATLPEREYVAGLGEIAKYALMGPQFDAAYGLDSLVRSGSSSLRSRDTGLLTRVIHGCVQLKADVVMDDPLEQSGRRASLNYGHTLGHALEIETHHELLHGEAIAIGLIFAAELACALGLLSLEATDRHYEIVSSLGLPTNAPSGCDAGRIVSLMKRDKKAAGGLTFMLRSGDDMKRVDDPPASAIAGALERVGITATHSAHDAGER